MGDLRFRRAQPLVALNESRGEEVIDAKEGDEGCARPVMNSTGVYVQGSYIGVEDCLSSVPLRAYFGREEHTDGSFLVVRVRLNVYTPKKSIKGKKLLPVLVW